MSVAGSAGTIVRRRIRVGGVVIAILGMILVPPCAEAQDKAQDKAPDRLGGHFGVVFPLVTRADGSTTGIGDNFKIGFPTGITIRKSDRFAYDLELVPTLDPRGDAPIDGGLTIHPGVLLGLGNTWTAGLRMAFDVGASSWGFTPLLNKGFRNLYFVELVVPVRFQDDDLGDTHGAITLGVHLGVGF